MKFPAVFGSEVTISHLCLQLTDFVERLLKHARNGDLQLMRRPLESKFGMLLTYRYAQHWQTGGDRQC